MSDTRRIFKDFKISRFNSRSVVNLSVLDRESERNIIQDYLVNGAGVDPKHPDINHWIERMIKETHQWAHHISCYGQVASTLVKNDGGVLSNDVLLEILKDARELKTEYYDGRFIELNEPHRASIYHALFENEVKENIIVGGQVKSDFEINPMIKAAGSMFQDIVSRGILQPRPDGFYQIPIPSLRTWMLQEYQNYLTIIDQKPSPQIQQLFKGMEFSINQDRAIE
ncbi:MAG: hypothetical protein OXC92_05280 [Flavobacteriaceae bacterium]|nr:hypothetical protein [Flavobacteriaceae bacterium]MCY4216377.1 hypothetical protein [Flavobacteriaceae bacterium]MCY4254263.1 hypothetical protein [Flavobacteriaceae bacterium]